MNIKDRLIKINIPENLDAALKIAKSISYWIEFIKNNPESDSDPFDSYGGHLELQLSALNTWFQYEKIKSAQRELNKTLERLK